MAIDTAAKRASAILTGIVIPDGTIAQTDRQTIAWVYGGIAAGTGIVIYPIGMVSGMVYLPGAQRGEVFIPGAQQSEAFIPGAQRGEVVT